MNSKVDKAPQFFLGRRAAVCCDFVQHTYGIGYHMEVI